MPIDTPQIMFGSVMHHRLRPVGHRFTYPVCFIRMPLSALVRSAHRWFSINRFNLFSLHFRDYGPGDGTPPIEWLGRLLREGGHDDLDGEIVLQTFPRVLGYVFNPVSFWYCHDRTGALRAIVAEVNNTFGERHIYLLDRPDRNVLDLRSPLSTRKVFHVSPFFPVAGEYRFAFDDRADRALVRIDYADASGDLLHTSISGVAFDWSPARFLEAFRRHGWMTAMIIIRIHVQALRLWLKRVTFHRKPEPPTNTVTR